MGRVSLQSSLRIHSLVVLAGALVLCGCNRIQVLVGAKVYIAKLPVTTMQVSLAKSPAIAPGEKSPLIATFDASDGKVWTTEGSGKGKILWSDVSVVASVVTYRKGVLSLPHDPRISDGKTGHITVTVPSHPGLRADLDVPLRYDYPFVANYSGSNGTNGTNGSDGTSGSTGSPGSIDPDNPSPGGNGGDGTSGGDGGNGSDGSDGPPVQVLITLRAGPHPLLQASVSAPGYKEHFYLVDPRGGTLTIRSDGGSGGSGGSGGRGGSGGSGGSGSPSGSSGSNGQDGHSGSSGSSGRPGTIAVTYDPSVAPYLAAIHTSNQGGQKPTFSQQPVAPLW